eukprot:2375262-Karenia_brevis.AAC.2
MVQDLRTMGADAVARTKQGRCHITAITVAKGIRWDPWVIGPIRQNHSDDRHTYPVEWGRCGQGMDHIPVGS